MQRQMAAKCASHSSFSRWAGRIGACITTTGLLIALAGCGLGSSSSSTNSVRSLNAYVPAVGTTSAITIATASTPLTGGLTLGFGQFSNGGSYISVPSGSFTPIATVAGTTTTFQPLTGTSLASNGTAYTVVATGEAGQTGALVPQVFVLPNYIAGQTTIPANSAAVRVVNVSLNLNPIALYSSANGVPTTVVNSGLSNVGYGYSSTANGYVSATVAQLTNSVPVDITAPQVPLSLASSSTLSTYTFTAGNAYTLYVYGQPGNSAEPLSATWVLDYPVQ